MRFWNFIQAHLTEIALVVYWFLSAAIGSLPMPTDKSSAFYDWFFKFANTFGANIFRVGASFGAKGPPQAPKP